jgi:prepilin-type N-terminal cleavage/methylation domain-containing protein
MRKQSGFTLIEIAIVLVIIGLLLGGVLKGQELITSARVRNLISQQDGIKAAYFGFLDRYRALPGDYNAAMANIPAVVATAACGNGNGNGNGQIEIAAGMEMALAWEHLSKAGFINGTYTCAAAETAATTPTNPYAMLLRLSYDNNYAGTTTNRHNLKTGNQIPSEIMAEVDRKIDDGNPELGAFRFTVLSVSGTAAIATGAGGCYTGAAATAAWNVATNPSPNCGGTSLF